MATPKTKPKTTNSKKSDDVFEISLSEDSVKLLLPFAILIAGILICAAIIYSTAQLKDAWSNSNTNSKTTINQETEKVQGAVTEVIQEDIPKSDKPLVQLFTMSYCPWGNVAEDFVEPVYQTLGENIEFEPRYIMNKDVVASIDEFIEYYGEDEAETQYSTYLQNIDNSCMAIDETLYCALHGPVELRQNVRETCVWKYQNEKYWDFVMSVNAKCDASNSDECWEEVAQEVGVSRTQVRECYDNELVSILEEEIALSNKLQVTGSPTIFINGVLYKGERSPEAFKNTICSAFNEVPESCKAELDSNGTSAAGGC